MTMILTYAELSRLPTFEERFEYLKLMGHVGEDTFGHNRYLNQNFYRSAEWRHIRDFVISRDNGCDLGVEGYDIYGRIYIHHMNPITQQDIIDRTDFLLNPIYMVAVSYDTHNAIHYGGNTPKRNDPIIRRPYDTCPWRR